LPSFPPRLVPNSEYRRRVLLLPAQQLNNKEIKIRTAK
jgi:hypothetical protein